jgi:N-acyl-D-aspartate/D-glutamate deacylase
MGMDDREPAETELEEMKKLVRTAMESGAAGLSTGLFYTPGVYAKTSEIVELAKVVKEFEGFYATHLRDESDYNIGLIEALKEAIHIGEQSGVRVEISHIKALGKPVWGLSGEVCRIIEEAKKRGITIFADQYPYNASSTGLASAIVPSWVRAEGMMTTRLNDKKQLPGIMKEIEENIERRGGPESLVVVSYPKDNRFDGKNLREISRLKGMPVVETAVDLILEGSPSIISFNMNNSDIATFMQKDYVMTCSDGHVEVPGENKPHPRNYGTFIRKIRKYVIEDKLITMQHAIRAATLLPAEMIGLKNRGSLEEGKIADVVIIDPLTVNDNATFDNPHQYSSGVKFLFVNGKKVISDGQYNGKLAGKALRLPDL